MKKPKPAFFAFARPSRHTVLIPEAEEGKKPLYGITPGYYDHEGVVALLRYNKRNPKAIQFIADMME